MVLYLIVPTEVKFQESVSDYAYPQRTEGDVQVRYLTPLLGDKLIRPDSYKEPGLILYLCNRMGVSFAVVILNQLQISSRPRL